MTEISGVYETRPTKVLRSGPVGGWAFNVKAAGFVEVKRYDTREEAETARAALLPSDDTSDLDAMERSLSEVMTKHVSGSITRRADGSWLVEAGDGTTYRISTKGEVT